MMKRCMFGCFLGVLAATGVARSQEYNFIRPERVVVLSAEQPGVITAKPVEPQDFVDAGELLVQLDPNLVELELAKTVAQLEAFTADDKAAIRLEYSQQNFDIVQDLYNTEVGSTRVGSPKELWEAQQTRDLARLELVDANRERRLLEYNRQQLEKRLSQLSVRAPFAGVVVSFASVKQVPNLENMKPPEQGETVQIGQSLIALMKVDRLRVPWSVPVEQLGRMRLGQEVRVYVPAGARESLPARVVFIDPTVDTLGKVSLEVEFDNPVAQWDGSGEQPEGWYRYEYRPGVSARVELGAGQGQALSGAMQ